MSRSTDRAVWNRDLRGFAVSDARRRVGVWEFDGGFGACVGRWRWGRGRGGPLLARRIRCVRRYEIDPRAAGCIRARDGHLWWSAAYGARRSLGLWGSDNGFGADVDRRRQGRGRSSALLDGGFGTCPGQRCRDWWRSGALLGDTRHEAYGAPQEGRVEAFSVNTIAKKGIFYKALRGKNIFQAFCREMLCGCRDGGRNVGRSRCGGG